MYKLNGNQVAFVPKAEVNRGLFGGPNWRGHKKPRYATLVQEAFDAFADDLKEYPAKWSKREPIIFSFDDAGKLPQFVTERTLGDEVYWGVYRFHTAGRPQASPFVLKPAGITTTLTIEVVGSGEVPLITRIYGGEYTPPLPWQASAPDAEGGREACAEFWKAHAFVMDTSIMGNLIDSTPEWAKVPRAVRV